MEITERRVPIRDLYDNYVNSGYDGVVGYGGLLDIRPAFQREFVYDDARQRAVINTILSKFPLNAMYWSLKPGVANQPDTFEMLDGQQRTMSICEYIRGGFSVRVNGTPKAFDNLSTQHRDRLLNYELMVYICEGDEDEQLDWFEVINIAGLTLKPQELRNAVYTGPWLTDAKRYFSRENQGAHRLARDYVNVGDVKRQDLLQKAIEWHAGKGDDTIRAYMDQHRRDVNANELWTYFKNVLDWAQLIFPHTRRPMKSVPWNVLYSAHHTKTLDAVTLEAEVSRLMSDDEVERKSGIYSYVLDGDERHLGLRVFTEAQKLKAYEDQQGICPVCLEHFEFEQMDGDHIDPWSNGGKTVQENCRMLCIRDNRGGS